MTRYQLSGIQTLDDGAQITNPILEIGDVQLRADGTVGFELRYYSGAGQTEPTLSRNFVVPFSRENFTWNKAVQFLQNKYPNAIIVS